MRHLHETLNTPFYPAHTNGKPTLLGDLLVFLLPILGFFKVMLIGELFLHEVILVALLPFLAVSSWRVLKLRPIAIILIMALLWLLSQLFTDWARNTVAEDYLRGWAKISFFIVSFASLAMLLSTPKRVFLWVAASVLPMYYRPLDNFAADLSIFTVWKFGVGMAVLTLLCLPWLWRVFKDPQRTKALWVIAAWHMLIGLQSFFFNARSLAGLAMMTGVLILVFSKYRGQVINMRRVFLASLVSALLALSLLQFYTFGASTGFFGYEAKEKYDLQYAGGESGIAAMLLGGRSESLVSTQAIADSPLLGHGSWAKNYKYTAIYQDLLAKETSVDEVVLKQVGVTDGLIPSHSYLFGAWVESGLLGGLFWMFILALTVFKVLPSAFLVGNGVAVVVLMSLPFLLWNILFSPFGANVRVEAASILVINCIVLVTAGRMWPAVALKRAS